MSYTFEISHNPGLGDFFASVSGIDSAIFNVLSQLVKECLLTAQVNTMPSPSEGYKPTVKAQAAEALVAVKKMTKVHGV